MFHFFRNDTLDRLAEMNDYLRRRVVTQEKLLRGQQSRIELLQKELSKWKHKRDSKGRFTDE